MRWILDPGIGRLASLRINGRRVVDCRDQLRGLERALA